MSSVLDDLDRYTVASSDLVEKRDDGSVRCFACAHRCLIKPGRRGICQVRANHGGELRVPWGYVAACNLDPIEKKPFSHVLPGADALTFGMLGCDLHCSYCQNWNISQVGRDEESSSSVYSIQPVQPPDVVRLAKRGGAQVVVSSYNEPLITSEWAVEIFKQSREAGLKCAYVSNGNATPEVIRYLAPYLSAYKIDLKSMRDAQYRKLGCVLNNVLDTIRLAHESGLWVEVVTLVVPGMNDSPEELWDAARYIASVSPDIPWHITAFHPDYRMDGAYTSPETLRTAAEIGQEAGLKFVYAGNLPGKVGSYEDTFCPHCAARLIHRSGYVLREYRITAQGACPDCGSPVPGVWTDRPETVRLGGPGFPRRASW